MAFSFRKIISNINYFKKADEETSSVSDVQTDENRRPPTQSPGKNAVNIISECTEPDSTSKQCSTSLEIPDSMKNLASKKGSLSDTDLLITIDKKTREKRRLRKLKVDIKKANKSLDDQLGFEEVENVENTPKHILLESKSCDAFSERIKKFDFSKSFHIFDAMSDESSFEEENLEIESLSDTDISLADEEEKANIKMCRKVGETDGLSNDDTQIIPSATPESFCDVETDKNDIERLTLLLNYQIKLEKMDNFFKKLLSEFQFHIEVSKIFQSRSLMTTLVQTDVAAIPKMLGQVALMDIDRGVSPTGSWNVIMNKEDLQTKHKIKNQLRSIKHTINEFMNLYLSTCTEDANKQKFCNRRSIMLYKENKQKHVRKYNKKKLKHFDFPDFRDAFIGLFESENDMTDMANSSMGNNSCKCGCSCHTQSDTDSGLTTKSDERSMSITSSIGNFSLDSLTLTAYSESLDQIMSYTSFQDTSLYNTLLQKPAVERITFYIQVHNIQIQSEQTDNYESKSVITFYCPTCKMTESEENGLLKHILSQLHCEKIHFQYKTVYIKKCVQGGKEIQPSTVLNPMTYYRDENKIVCFGDAMYACSLCFEKLIVGESVLMGHCIEQEHVENREKLCEIED